MTVETRASRITGEALPAEHFRVHETAGRLDVGKVVDVLEGRLAAYRMSGFVPATDCRAITRNFWSSTRLTRRYGQGVNGIEAYILGASHIERTTSEYLADVARSADAVGALCQGVADPMVAFRTRLVAAGAVANARSAQRNGRHAGSSKAVCWNNVGAFLLLPHDDLAQLRDPRQSDFEIQRVQRVMAVNIYPHVPGRAGQVRMWNVAPDDDTRARLGLTHSGYPYPPHLLAGHPSLLIPVETGDLCVINGNLAHAVLGGGPNTEPGRLLLTCFTGLVDDELVWWT